MMGAKGCWRKAYSLSEDRVFSLCQPRDNKESVRIIPHTGGMRNTCSIIRHSESVCISKVLYITVIMHQGILLAQPLFHSRVQESRSRSSQEMQRAWEIGRKACLPREKAKLLWEKQCVGPRNTYSFMLGAKSIPLSAPWLWEQRSLRIHLSA